MVNRATLIGNVGREPESKQLPSGNVVAEFSLATTRKWRDGNGDKREETTWHNVKAFGKLAEIILQYVHKGDKVYVSGRIENRSWEKDGVKHHRSEVVADEMQMLGGKREQGEREQADAPADTSEPGKPFEATLADIPF